MPSYNPQIVTAFFAENGIPKPKYEFVFAQPRKWRFDLCWSNYPTLLAIEVQGGIWQAGRHNRGAAMLKEWEKLNTAASLGWRILYCQPKGLCTVEFAEVIKRALEI